ncbi:MAG: SMC-Scp complex subunit ScpB [Phycisphaerales bacterium]
MPVPAADSKSSSSASASTSSDAKALSLASRVEALLITSEKPLSPARLGEALEIGLDDGGSKSIEDAIEELNEVYDESGRAFRVERVAGGYRMMTRPEFGGVVQRFRESRSSSRLSQAALETLAIVAYRQPITRADIEAIRGVACGEVLRSLLERHLIKITGRAEEVGRPMLYGTTREFLEAFGLASLKDLPDAKELQGG